MADQGGWQPQPPNYKPPVDMEVKLGPAPASPPKPMGPPPGPQPVAPTPAAPVPEEFKGLPVRAGGDKVFVLKMAKRDGL